TRVRPRLATSALPSSSQVGATRRSPTPGIFPMSSMPMRSTALCCNGSPRAAETQDPGSVAGIGRCLGRPQLAAPVERNDEGAHQTHASIEGGGGVEPYQIDQG